MPELNPDLLPDGKLTEGRTRSIIYLVREMSYNGYYRVHIICLDEKHAQEVAERHNREKHPLDPAVNVVRRMLWGWPEGYEPPPVKVL